MNVLKKNIAANFVGSIWQAVMGLAFIPLYIKFMGIESYGLIGIFATLQAIFVLLDMGLGATLTREMARLSAIPGKGQEIRDLVRSLEIIYWFVAIFIGIVVMAISHFIAYHWVKAGQLSPQTIEQAIRIMGLVMALQWPASFYTGGLVGLQKQVLFNVINIGTSTLRGVGAVLILWLISPTIQAFFLWQIIISIINTCVLAFFLWHSLPHAQERASFQKSLITGVWRFAAGMAGVSFSSTILLQMDKILLSKLLPLTEFGYYTFAASVAGVLYRLFSPIFSAYYPHLTEIVSRNDQSSLIKVYHQGCQLMAVVILPLALCMAMFSAELLEFWTNNHQLVARVSIVVTLLTMGNMFGALMNIPYALQLAYGWFSLTFYTNMIAVVILVPVVYFATQHWGMVGAATVWMALNIGYVLFQIQIMHRRLLIKEKMYWYINDVGKPLLVVSMIVVMGRLLLIGNLQNYEKLFRVIIIFCLAVIGAVGGLGLIRGWIFSVFRNIKIIE